MNANTFIGTSGDLYPDNLHLHCIYVKDGEIDDYDIIPVFSTIDML